jgi:hypothetical protein
MAASVKSAACTIIREAPELEGSEVNLPIKFPSDAEGVIRSNSWRPERVRIKISSVSRPE